jgi:hypothetical protein
MISNGPATTGLALSAGLPVQLSFLQVKMTWQLSCKHQQQRLQQLELQGLP